MFLPLDDLVHSAYIVKNRGTQLLISRAEMFLQMFNNGADPVLSL